MTIQTLKKERKCKNSVVFKADKSEKNPMVTSIYLMNKAYEDLDSPEEINISVSRT